MDTGGRAAEVVTRLGRRGAVLLILGVLWILQGAGVYLDPTDANAGGELLLHERIPTELRTVLWAGTGLVAVAYALRPNRDRSDRWGFLALVLLPVERAGSFGWAFLMWVIPGVPVGFARALIGAAVWSGVAAVVIIVAGWREPAPTIAEVLTRDTTDDGGCRPDAAS